VEISLTTILAKMAEEIHKAQSQQNIQHIREHAAVIRALCDLVLESPSEQGKMSEYELLEKYSQSTLSKTERIDIGEDANGSSLFEF
jgi:hypothetical protein